MENPKLRSVEIFPVREGLFALRDPLRYTDQILVVPSAVLALIALFDGTRPLSEAVREFEARYGQALAESKVDEIADSLDANGFLESAGFREKRAGIDAAFAAAPVREAAHAGTGYEAEPQALRQRLDGLFEALGPDGGAVGSASAPGPDRDLRGVIVPHIDLRRGGSGYAHGYSEIRRRASHVRIIVLLGISHVETKNRYAFTRKDFATPLGTLKTDVEAVQRIADALPFDAFEDEPAHRAEHSLEFQAVFIRYIFPNRDDISIVPILCGPLLGDFSRQGSPSSDPQVGSLVAALKSLVAGRRDVLLVAGADLSHVGPRFGGSEPFTEQFFEDARSADLRMLEEVLRLDAEGFIGFIQREGDRRNVCGIPAIYTMLATLRCGGAPAPSGRLLSYDLAVDQAGQSAVGFTSVAFDGPP